jgi:hypothetical protein
MKKHLVPITVKTQIDMSTAMAELQRACEVDFDAHKGETLNRLRLEVNRQASGLIEDRMCDFKNEIHNAIASLIAERVESGIGKLVDQLVALELKNRGWNP